MTRGYTDHEQFDDLGIIHMNGRIYDADLGRFLSADPLVPHPYFSQSYNRYSYVMNNPMSLTDPSGFEDDKCQGRWGDIPLEDAEELDICGGFGSCNPGASPSPAPSAPKGPTLINQYTQNPSTRAYHFVEKRMSDFKRWDSAPEFSRDWDRQTFANVGSAVVPDAVASGEVGGGGFSGWLDNIQLGLDVAGMTPGLGAAADATNAVIHLARGNWAGAALSSIAIIPLIGDAAALAKMADRVGDAAKSADAAKGGTYVLKDAEGGVMRSGRTNDLARREMEHARDPELKDFRFQEVHRTDVRSEQRGLEQMLHDQHQPPLNKIRPISPSNPKINEYMDAARRFLGGD